MEGLFRWSQAYTVTALGYCHPSAPRPTTVEFWDCALWFSGAHRITHKNNPLIGYIDELIMKLSTLVRTPLSDDWKVRSEVINQQFLPLVLELDSGLRRILCETWNLLANIDSLTGIGNRVAMRTRLDVERGRQQRSQQPCCLAVLDIDRFKAINDQYGHLAGDVVLRKIAALLAANIRPYDEVFRYGGDEFVICLPSADMRSVWAVVERLRVKVANLPINLKQNRTISVTVSIGVSPLTGEYSVDENLDLADAALYAAKREGRDRIRLVDRPLQTGE
ncbi:MAG: diguanylate cyclase [Rhodospirillales bacterium]|nr:diguanylate cyclase [Rhodospirillales bacterium]